MSSYHSSFKYLNKTSLDECWIITHIDGGETGEVDSFLSTEGIYAESYNGTRKMLYGAKYDTTAVVKITVMKKEAIDCYKTENGNPCFSIDDNRRAFKWLTGSQQASWLDLYIGNETEDDHGNKIPKYRVLGRVQDVKQERMDSKIIALHIYFESVSPYAYSPLKTEVCTLTGPETFTVKSDSDDLYNYVYLKTIYQNTTGDSLTIKNNTTGEETVIENLVQNETITISDNMMITSDNTEKKFGNSFNFVFPRLKPLPDSDVNEFTVNGSIGSKLTFEYILPIKVGDMVTDLNAVSDPIYDDEGNIKIDMLNWGRITDTPTTIHGYGITDAYTKTEVDTKIANVTIGNVYTKDEIDQKLKEFVSDDVYTKNEIDNKFGDYYTKSEVDTLLSSVKVAIDENELNAILAEVLI